MVKSKRQTGIERDEKGEKEKLRAERSIKFGEERGAREVKERDSDRRRGRGDEIARQNPGETETEMKGCRVWR